MYPAGPLASPTPQRDITNSRWKVGHSRFFRVLSFRPIEAACGNYSPRLVPGGRTRVARHAARRYPSPGTALYGGGHTHTEPARRSKVWPVASGRVLLRPYGDGERERERERERQRQRQRQHSDTPTERERERRSCCLESECICVCVCVVVLWSRV